MKKTSLIFLLVCLTFAAFAQQKTISISNPLSTQRQDEVIEIPWDQLTAAYPTLTLLILK